eukprot:2127499-Rhodomonas_salina.1
MLNADGGHRLEEGGEEGPAKDGTERVEAYVDPPLVNGNLERSQPTSVVARPSKLAEEAEEAGLEGCVARGVPRLSTDDGPPHLSTDNGPPYLSTDRGEGNAEDGGGRRGAVREEAGAREREQESEDRSRQESERSQLHSERSHLN